MLSGRSLLSATLLEEQGSSSGALLFRAAAGLCCVVLECKFSNFEDTALDTFSNSALRRFCTALINNHSKERHPGLQFPQICQDRFDGP